MRAVIQRVNGCFVQIGNDVKSNIGKGLLVLLGIESDDGMDDIEYLCKKISNLRVFNDKKGVMNISIKDIQGEIMVVSQFTLHASTKKGNRPSYIKAANPETAVPLYEKFIERIQEESDTEIQTGVFGADMKISLINDGPVTIIIDTKNRE